MKDKKMLKLKSILRDMGSAVIAFSGGSDSTLLLRVSLDILGKDKVLAVTAVSESFPRREYEDAILLAKRLGARHIRILTGELQDPRFLKNLADRCYYCKKALYKKLLKIAQKKGFAYVADGFNFDDKNDMRYGNLAAKELGVRSPLAEAKIGKRGIRTFSRRLELPTWNKPSFACLVSRLPYFKTITKEKLKKVEKAEDYLYGAGLRQARVRLHDDMARIEVWDKDIGRILKKRKEIARKFKGLGFTYVALDLEGYRTGSLNEVLPKGLTK